MGGLARICKALGAITIDGTKHVWDYAHDLPVLESDMPIGSERWECSERARAEYIRKLAQSATNGDGSGG